MQAVESMRAHPVYAMFEKRWQLPVYFQMRWKEIVGKIEEALVLPIETPTGKNAGMYYQCWVVIILINSFFILFSEWGHFAHSSGSSYLGGSHRLLER